MCSLPNSCCVSFFSCWYRSSTFCQSRFSLFLSSFFFFVSFRSRLALTHYFLCFCLVVFLGICFSIPVIMAVLMVFHISSLFRSSLSTSSGIIGSISERNPSHSARLYSHRVRGVCFCRCIFRSSSVYVTWWSLMPGRTFVRLILSGMLVSVRSNVFVRRGGFRDHLCKSIVGKKYFKFFMKGGVWASRFNFFLRPVEARGIEVTTYGFCCLYC